VTPPVRTLVYGFATTGQAVARALVKRGLEAVLVDDHPSTDAREAAELMGMEVLESPSRAQLARLVEGVDALAPSPGIPDLHPVFEAVAVADVPVISEFDLAREWDHRPMVAITGTDGKTTVTSLVTGMLQRSGTRALTAGNDAMPLVEAIDRDDVDVFVVEASSFRLGHTRQFEPRVATWLNFAPDHLDVHRSVEAYERAKARIWTDVAPDGSAIANADDPVVMRNRNQTRRAITFSTAIDADYCVVDGQLRGPGGAVVIDVDELGRSMPHDVSNALAAAATATAAGASIDAVREGLREFRGLPHRVELIGEWRGVRWFDDSKATVPHATLAAVRGFHSVVLIAGGRNKGVDLAPLAGAREHVRAVVAMGEAADEVEAVFGGLVPVERVHTNMDDVVTVASDLAESGDAVLLSPGCASFDWFTSYEQRGDAFRASVERQLHHTVEVAE